MLMFGDLLCLLWNVVRLVILSIILFFETRSTCELMKLFFTLDFFITRCCFLLRNSEEILGVFLLSGGGYDSNFPLQGMYNTDVIKLYNCFQLAIFS